MADKHTSTDVEQARSAAFDNFKVGLSDWLTLNMILELAILFRYPAALIDQLMNTREGAALVMVSRMEERGQISPTDISPLMNALQQRNYTGIARSVGRLFKEATAQPGSCAGKTEEFIEQLKFGYKRFISSIRPVPFQFKWRAVQHIYVGSNLERMCDTDQQDKWERVESHTSLLKEETDRVILEGEPGYGKSILCLQLVYEWCASQLLDIDVLIFLRLREVSEVSIYDAIMNHVLPEDCKLSKEDIESIITSGKIKLCFLLDGYDEFQHQSFKCHITSIINSLMFPLAKVVTTTRPTCLPNLIAAVRVTRFRLGGFDEDMQRKYIEKSVLQEGSNISLEGLMKIFEENPLLTAICQTPLFFGLFANIFHENVPLRQLHSVTAYIRFMINCFLGHESNKNATASPSDLLSSSEFESQSLLVARVAFEGLKTDRKIFEWECQHLKEMIGKDCYLMFMKAGILVSEHSLAEVEDFGLHIGGSCFGNVKTRFFHKILQEFFAAFHWKVLAKDGDSDILRMLRNFDPNELTLFFLFSCGLNKTVASTVITDLLGRGDSYEEILRQCILEVNEAIPSVVDAATLLCQQKVWVHSSDSKLSHRATIHLLNMASNQEMHISCVDLDRSFASVDREGSAIVLSSGLSLPSLMSVEEIDIWTGRGREIFEDEWAGLLNFAQRSKLLTGIKIFNCLLPQHVNAEALRSRWSRFTVIWNAGIGIYQLSHTTRNWQRLFDDENDITDEEYNELVKKFRHFYRWTSWQTGRFGQQS